MKIGGCFLSFLLALMIDVPSEAAIPYERVPNYVAPEESVSVLRSNMALCQSRERGSAGQTGLSFLSLETAACPGEPRKAVGWDRPEVEPVSPGIPFQDQGIER